MLIDFFMKKQRNLEETSEQLNVNNYLTDIRSGSKSFFALQELNRKSLDKVGHWKTLFGIIL